MRKHVPAQAIVINVVALACAVLVIAHPSAPDPLKVGAIGSLSFAIGACLDRVPAALTLAALVASLQIAMGFSEFPNLEIGFVTLIPWWAGTQFRARRALLRELAQRNHELENEEALFVHLAVMRERAVIAHELHDIVGHHLAVVVVQAGAGRIATGSSQEAVVDRFATIRAAGEQALAEMRRLVEVLQAGDERREPIADRLAALIARARAAGLTVRVTSPPAGLALPAGTEDSAIRVLQEGLTNTIKHAPGATVDVIVTVAPDGAELEVRDDGQHTDATLAATGSGLGLTGMRDRIESLGGRLEAGPLTPRGWSLRAHLPGRTAWTTASTEPPAPPRRPVG
jgi:signal transduction histidine kinase